MQVWFPWGRLDCLSKWPGDLAPVARLQSPFEPSSAQRVTTLETFRTWAANPAARMLSTTQDQARTVLEQVSRIRVYSEAVRGVDPISHSARL